MARFLRPTSVSCCPELTGGILRKPGVRHRRADSLGCGSWRIYHRLMKDAAALPSDLAAAHAMILSERAARLEAEAAAARASGICSTLMINSYYSNQSEM